jgi:hypothetical protein
VKRLEIFSAKRFGLKFWPGGGVDICQVRRGTRRVEKVLPVSHRIDGYWVTIFDDVGNRASRLLLPPLQHIDAATNELGILEEASNDLLEIAFRAGVKIGRETERRLWKKSKR